MTASEPVDFVHNGASPQADLANLGFCSSIF